MKWAGCVAHMGYGRHIQKNLVTKPRGKKSFVRSRHRWEIIKMDLNEIERHRMEDCGIKDTVQWQTVVNTVNNFWVTQKAFNFSSGSVRDKAFAPCG